jgi:hypothetical protein
MNITMPRAAPTNLLDSINVAEGFSASGLLAQRVVREEFGF